MRAAACVCAALCRCTVDFSSLSAILAQLGSEQTSAAERLRAIESGAESAAGGARENAAAVRALQSESASTAANVGELRVGLQRLRSLIDEQVLPAQSASADWARRADLPCTRAEFEQMRLQLQALTTAQQAQQEAAANAPPPNDTSNIALSTDLQNLRAEIAELQLANSELAGQLRELQSHRKLPAPEPPKPGPPLGNTASAMMLVGSGGSAALPDDTDGTPAAVLAASKQRAPSTAAVAALAETAATATVGRIDAQVSALTRQLGALQADMAQLRSGFREVHALTAVPFVAPTAAVAATAAAAAGPSTEPKPNAAAAGTAAPLPLPQMIAVSLQCDHCTSNSAAVFCVHCEPSLQKLCSGCDALVHAFLAPSATPGEAAAAIPGRRTAAMNAAPGSGPATSTAAGSGFNAASKHLRLEISRAVQPGSKLFTSDLGFIRHQTESAALAQVLEEQLAARAAAAEASERLDRHEMQFSALALSLNAVDEGAERSAALERDVLAVRSKAMDGERAVRELKSECASLKDRLTLLAAAQSRGGGAGAGSFASGFAPPSTTPLPMPSQSLAAMSVVTATNNPVTASIAKQLHAELDAHKQQVEAALADQAARLDTMQSVELSSLSSGLSALQRSAVSSKAHLSLVERCVSLEQQVRAQGTGHAFTATKLANHIDLFTELLSVWTCQHCDTNALACGGSCADPKCGKRICWECSKQSRTGHMSEVASGGGVGGGGVGAGGLGASHHLLNSNAIQVVVESSPALRELHARVQGQAEATAAARRAVDALATRMAALLDLFAKLNLVAPVGPPSGDNGSSEAPLKLGPSAALLLDPRALGYFDALGTLFQQSLPEVLTRLLAAEERSSNQGDQLSKLERRAREVELASRPFVEERVAMLTERMAQLDKSIAKKLRAEVRRYEATVADQRAAKERESSAAMAAETSIARVHFRCVACDQVVGGQPGPLSKEYAAQLAAHQAQVHGLVFQPPPPQTTVGGFASASAPLNPSALQLQQPPQQLQQQQQSGSGGGIVSPSMALVPSDRGHMFIEPGQRTTLHSHSGSEVFRGREDGRVLFTSPAAAAAAGADRSTFQTSYPREVVVPSGSTRRSVGGQGRGRGGGGGGGAGHRHSSSASSTSSPTRGNQAAEQPQHAGASLPRLAHTQPISSSHVVASGSATTRTPQHSQPHPPGSQSQRGPARSRPSAAFGAEVESKDLE